MNGGFEHCGAIRYNCGLTARSVGWLSTVFIALWGYLPTDWHIDHGSNMSLIHRRMSCDSGDYSVTGQPAGLVATQPSKPFYYLAEDYSGPSSTTERRHLLNSLGVFDLDGYTDAQLDDLWQIKLQEARAAGAPGKLPQKKISYRERFEKWLVAEYGKETSDEDIRSKLRQKSRIWAGLLHKGAIRQQVIAICKRRDWDLPSGRRRGRKPGKSGPKQS
jgi:hypothetical protein